MFSPPHVQFKWTCGPGPPVNLSTGPPVHMSSLRLIPLKLDMWTGILTHKKCM